MNVVLQSSALLLLGAVALAGCADRPTGPVPNAGLAGDVSDQRIEERLRSMTSAKQACEDLLRDALDSGGSDGIAIAIGRTVRKDRE